jgi:hypothetical protein
MPLRAFGKKTLSPALAPSRKGRAATFCAHACAKTVLTFSRSFRWLEGALHI